MNIYELLRMRGQLPPIMGGPAAVLEAMRGNALGAGGPGTPVRLPPNMLSAPPPAPANPARGGGFLAGLDRLLGGNAMEGLDPSQAADARRQGLLAAGAQLLMASGRRPGPRATFTELLGQGLAAGQQGYGQGIAQGQAQQAEQRRAELFAGAQPQPGETPQQTYARLQSLMGAALQSGDIDAARSVSEVLKSMSGVLENPAPKAPGPLVAGGDGFYYRQVVPSEQHPDGLVRTSVKTPDRDRDGPALITGEPKPVRIGGKMVMAVYDRRARRYIPIEGAEPGNSRGLNATQAKAASFIPAVQSDAQTIRQTIATIDPGGKWLASAGPGNLGQLLRARSPQAQALANSAGTAAEAWLRMTTGAAYNDVEYTNAVNRFLIRPTDAKETVRWKLDNLRRLENMLRTIASTPGAAGGDDDLSDLDADAEE